MTDIVLNIHDLVRVRLRCPPEWLATRFERHLGRFIAVQGSAAKADVSIQHMPAEQPFKTLCTLPGPQHRLGCAIHNGHRGILLLYHHNPDVGIFPGACVKVLHARRPRAFRRIYGMTLFAIHFALQRKRALLFHGACLCRGTKTVLVTGSRGSGKTLLLLALLRRGWEYLADDKLVLHKGKAHLFESVIRLTDHHIRSLPWLLERLPADIRRKRAHSLVAFRRLIGRAGAAVLPDRLAMPWERKWNPLHVISVSQLFPGIRMLEAGRPDLLIHLRPSARLGSRSVTRQHMIARVVSVQRMMFQDMAPLDELLTTFCDTRLPALEDILDENLAAQEFVEFDMPVGGDLERISGAFAHCIEQV